MQQKEFLIQLYRSEVGKMDEHMKFGLLLT